MIRNIWSLEFDVSIIIFEWSYGRNKNIRIQNLKRRLGTWRSRLGNIVRNVNLRVLRANQSTVLFVRTCRNVRIDWTWWANQRGLQEIKSKTLKVVFGSLYLNLEATEIARQLQIQN